MNHHQDFITVTTPTKDDRARNKAAANLSQSDAAHLKARGIVETVNRGGTVGRGTVDQGTARRLINADNATSAAEIKLNVYGRDDVARFNTKCAQGKIKEDKAAQEMGVPRQDIKEFKAGRLQKSGKFSNALRKFLA